MTAAPAVSVVTVERFENVIAITWHTPEPPSSGTSRGEDATSARRRAPLSHRVRGYGLLVGLIVAGPLCMALQAMGVGQ